MRYIKCPGCGLFVISRVTPGDPMHGTSHLVAVRFHAHLLRWRVMCEASERRWVLRDDELEEAHVG